jgi:lipopolysaccharide/colanic/teichoic acid biosynthesis glycosyltransferase
MWVKPGLTGLAQINGGYDMKPEEKIVYDTQYLT